MKWISVKERMPKIGECVYAGYWNEYNEFILDKYLCYCSHDDPTPRFGDCYITHWVPIEELNLPKNDD